MTFIELLDKHPMAAVIELGVAFVGVARRGAEWRGSNPMGKKGD